jgi:hypothetical protein
MLNIMKRSLKSLIGEEIKNIINEGYVMNDDRFKFQHRVENPSFFNTNSFSADYDTDISESNITIFWNVSFWLNDFGIENLIINVEKVEGTYTLELINKQSGETEQESEKNINEIEWNFIVDDATLQKGGSLYVSDLIFDFAKKTCEVQF